jgi:hypothetical protein
MKSNVFFVLILACAFCFYGCEDPTVPDAAEDLSGIYIGEAEILIEETRWNVNGETTELVLVDTLIVDNIEVSAISLQDSMFQIERASDFFSSFYDFEGAISLSQDYTWQIAYAYDKAWETNIQFYPTQDSLTAYMIVNDIFESYKEDADGNVLYFYVKSRAYSINAIR